MTYIIGIILVGGLIFFMTSCSNKSIDNNTTTNIDTSKEQGNQMQENTFEELRNMAFSVKPEQLGLLLPTDQTIVYGVIMDWEMGGGIATIISYQTGDASLYLSSGGGVIGGGQHENVSNVTKQFVSLAQTFIAKATKTEATILPATDQVKFYLLTTNGIYVGQDIISNFENNTSEWLQLFEEGNNVLTELRMITSNK